jgi:hypothetical protein
MSISVDASLTPNVYIKEELTVYGVEYSYSTDRITWFTLNTNPWTIANLSATTMLKVIFDTDFTFDAVNQYISILTPNIQIGDTSRKPDGTKPIITISNIINYPGFVRNGSDAGDGKDNIRIVNINVVAYGTSTLAPGAGWIGQYRFAKNALNNSIVDCVANGNISSGGAGGIVGSYAASDSGQLRVIGCYCSGIIESSSGGIVGGNSGGSGSQLYISNCFTNQDMLLQGGGILGPSSSYVTIENCYSEGEIGGNGGGIAANNCSYISITKCYSRGDINNEGGGIIGGSAANITITNCYSSGDVLTDMAGGIVGNGYTSATVTNCYKTGTVGTAGPILANSTSIPVSCAYTSSWSDTIANQTLLTVAATWLQPSTPNTPYLLKNALAGPYSLETVVVLSGQLTVNRTVAQTIAQGSTGPTAAWGIDASGVNFTLYSASDPNFSDATQDSQTGAITVPSTVPPGVYTVYTLYPEVGYSVTEITVTVPGAGPGPGPGPDPNSEESNPNQPTPPYIERISGEDFNEIQVGNYLIVERWRQPNKPFGSYRDYLFYKKALASRS